MQNGTLRLTVSVRVCARSHRVQLNEAQDEIMKKKELLEDLQPDVCQTCESDRRHLHCSGHTAVSALFCCGHLFILYSLYTAITNDTVE